ncbi:MAG: ABC transporter substrate-binding protein [Candidatus Bipolaricaulaceae bacterium]
MVRAGMVITAVLACLVVFAGLAQSDVEAAKAEGKVTFYANITAIEPVIAAFADTYGISVEYVRIATDKFIPTVLSEYQAGKLLADVVQGPLPILQILKEKGVLGTYVSPQASSYPEWAIDKDGVIQLFGIEYVCILYNTELVPPEDVPTSYLDLADPKWRDKIVMPDPTVHATTISWLVALKEEVFESEAAWVKWLQGIAANRPLFVASFGPTPDPIARGERALGISMPKYIITKAPAPLGWANVTEGLFGSPRGIAIVKNPRHPEAAKLFIDFWLSEVSVRLLAEKVGEYVLYEGIYPPIPGIDQTVVRPIRDLSDEEIQAWSQFFAGIFK